MPCRLACNKHLKVTPQTHSGFACPRQSDEVSTAVDGHSSSTSGYLRHYECQVEVSLVPRLCGLRTSPPSQRSSRHEGSGKHTLTLICGTQYVGCSECWPSPGLAVADSSIEGRREELVPANPTPTRRKGITVKRTGDTAGELTESTRSPEPQL